MDDIKEELEQIKRLLITKFNPLAIILFGSYSRNSQREDSDIDIAMIANETSKNELFVVKSNLEEQVKRDIDLINLNSEEVYDSFKYEVLMNGIVIYCKDEYKYDLYKITTIREYLELNESRQDIIKRIKEEYMENKSVILNKFERIEKCINRINEEYQNNPENLDDYRKMDMIVLNLQRACEAVLDLAVYIVSTRKLGLPQTKREAFILLEKNNIIDSKMSKNMQGMVGFRNIAVHDYKEIDEEILKDVIENHLNDLLDFARILL